MIELLLRITFSLLVVFGLMWGLARIARRPLARRGGGAVTVLARQQLTRGSSIAVVQVADRALILGVTEGQVSMLAEADLETVREQVEDPAPRRDRPPDSRLTAPLPAREGALRGSLLSRRTWSQTLEFLRERTVRR